MFRPFLVLLNPCTDLIEKCIPLIDVQYFAGKCFILAFSDHDFCEEDALDISKLAEKYQLPLHYVVKRKAHQQRDVYVPLEVPHRLLSIYCPPVGCDVSTSTVLAAMTYPLI
ncbi:hypothetical protein ElyMa_000394100 [Elysia marginata]|uniref:Uncharacterized protein n=1 Tax=Elysia marginata TaxID=1093978 RepID=A0AAV4FJW2_9GAST|nr:hypothetical protein ElyMa_000394100 [Elysia marginata]